MKTKEELNKLLFDSDVGLLADELYESDPDHAEFLRLWKLVKRQRLINKLIKEIYYESGVFSYRQMIMAVANLARRDSYLYTDRKFPELKKLWFTRYNKLRKLKEMA